MALRLFIALALVAAVFAADANFGCDTSSTANWATIHADKFASKEPAGFIPRDKLKVRAKSRARGALNVRLRPTDRDL